MKNAMLAVVAATVLVGGRVAQADATSDLWTALKGANNQDALAAIAKGPDVKNFEMAYGTPLGLAANFAGPEVVKALIDAKSDINFVHPANGYTPLMNAAHWGNTEAVKVLLAAGASVKVKAKMGQTLLHVALTNGCKLEILKLLVEAGADPKETYRLGSLTVDLNLLNSVVGVYSPKEKIKNLASIQPAMLKAGMTYPERLQHPKESDFSTLEELTRYILEKGGFNPNQKVIGTWGCILNQAVEFGKDGVVQALLEAKANTEVPILVAGKLTGLQATPLMVAALKGNTAIAELLLKAGAKVNAVGVQTKVESSHSAGTTTYTTFKLTNNALSLANDNGHPETAALIQKYGGTPP